MYDKLVSDQLREVGVRMVVGHRFQAVDLVAEYDLGCIVGVVAQYRHDDLQRHCAGMAVVWGHPTEAVASHLAHASL